MGQRNPDRELRDARIAYVGAVGRFRQALAAFDDSGTPMDPGPDPEPYPWTGDQVRIIMTLAGAVDEWIEARRTWDGLRREQRQVH